nr:MAG TPA: DNA cytosine methyltransferase [Caudoviricetes sp.]
MTQTSMLDYLIVDNFAGGGGASCGIELATGRPVNIAINHDPAAIAMHKANHPYTEHYQESVWDIDPKEICRGQPVGLAWFSPDCKHFSKAKGGKPVDKNIRGLAWIVLKWAGEVRPRVIILENVVEFQTWGPVRKGQPVKSKQGETFERWKSQLAALGYEIEYRELKACDYGAPTIRKRFFLIARCDGEPIVFPEPTHGPADSPEVKSGKLKPYRTAADCIDFTLPCQSIFDRKKPLAVNTQRRIARGLDKFVIKESKPFILPIGYGERNGQKPRVHDIEKPLPTIVSSCKQYLCTPYLTKFQQHSRGQSIINPFDTIMPGATRFGLIAPALIQYHSETAKAEVRGQNLYKPIMTIDSSPRYGVFIPYLSKYFGGVVGADVQSPMPTVTAIDHNALSMSFLTKYYSGKDQSFSCNSPLHTITTKDRISCCNAYLTILRNNMDCRSVNEPLNTITTSGAHFAYTKVYVKKYQPGCNLYNWSKVRELLNTYTEWNLANDEILIFNINGIEHFIYDIGLRMLQPKELYKAQGFPDDYIIETDCNGKAYPKSKQVARCGNAVPPPFAKALVMANCPWLCDKHCNNMAEFNSVAAG